MLTTEERKVLRYAREAKRQGADGEPCPYIPDVTPCMKRDNVRLLAHAFALKRCARGPDDLVDLLTEIVTLIAAQWQTGAQKRKGGK